MQTSQDHRRHQQGRRSSHLRAGGLRAGRGPVQGRPGAHRGDQASQGGVVSGSAATPDELLRTLADPGRLAVAGLIAAAPRTVADLAGVLAERPNRVRRHLSRLAHSGIVRVDEDRRTYRLDASGGSGPRRARSALRGSRASLWGPWTRTRRRSCASTSVAVGCARSPPGVPSASPSWSAWPCSSRSGSATRRLRSVGSSSGSIPTTRPAPYLVDEGYPGASRPVPGNGRPGRGLRGRGGRHIRAWWGGWRW